MTETRVVKSPWPYRSTTPGASDSFDIEGLQALLRLLDEHSTWVQPTAPDLPHEGDRWSDTATNTSKVFFGAQWRTVGQVVSLVKAGPPVDADFPSAPADGTLALDSTSERLYCRVNGFWKYSALI